MRAKVDSLQDIAPGMKLKGLIGDSPVEIIALNSHGPACTSVVYKTEQGALGEIMVYADMANDLAILNSKQWSLDADPNELKLASEAYRISLAYLFDPYLAIRTSNIEPLPHQISAVYQEMLPKMPLRFLLADDPGAGKTIMTGLLVKEMLVRGDLKRCLIVSPGNLVEQWQDELYRKFGLHFKILTNDMISTSVTGNVFKEVEFCIARLDMLSRNENLQEKLQDSRWDLIVCDEAHKLSASVYGNDIKYTKRYHLGELLGDITENFLLLTATPHNGKPDEFQLFLALIDKDRFEGAIHSARHFSYPSYATPEKELGLKPNPIYGVDDDLSDVMRRLIKEELVKFDGRPLFPERLAYTVNYSLSPTESALYDAVTKYVSDEFNRADRLDGKRKNSVGFALTILQRRLASSPEAIYQSLKRRHKRLQSRLIDMNEIIHKSAAYSDMSKISDEFDEDDYTYDELDELEDEFVDTASASATLVELKAEINTLEALEKMANNVRMSGEDRKWDELSKLLQDERSMFSADGSREKLIIFTEHKDTLDYLATKIRSLLGNYDTVLTIKGGMSREERHKVEERFKQDKDVRILVATDAAGEGINLQRAHLMINYDLPWNPNRLEQRFGRIHRIGQTEVCHLWNLVANETREGQVFERLLNKLKEESAALGGRVFDILGRITFDNKPLKDLLVEAIRYGNQPEVQEHLNQIVDTSLDTKALHQILEQYALTEDVMDIHDINLIKEDMERMELRKLEPHFIESFFKEAFVRLGGVIEPREPGYYEVVKTPFEIRAKDMRIGYADPVLDKYERICFSKEKVDLQNGMVADLICPGHPLLNSTIEVILDKYSSALKLGSILIDDANETDSPRMLYYLESSVLDGNTEIDGTRKVISKNIHFVEMDQNGNARNAGYAPYLDYRSPDESELQKAKDIVSKMNWSSDGIEKMAEDYAISKIIPDHLKEVKNRVYSQTDKIESAVEKRLKAEIQYWDLKAWELKDKEASGKTNNKLNSFNAQKRADELANRLAIRKEELRLSRQLSPCPPRIIGGAMIIPSYLVSDSNTNHNNKSDAAGKHQVELAAMRAVMAIERELGYIPEDVSKEKVGYDIKSSVSRTNLNPDEISHRFIEVKGRAAGSTTVTVSKNEILAMLNSPTNTYLAIVEVDGTRTNTVYLQNPFINPPDFTSIGVNFDIKQLLENSEIVFKKEHIWE
ncbi:MAG: SNF2-related protein [Eggerthellaceae bacterium]|nr:SNF2-related protein [Eggerthellaceae bacterium]